MKEYPDISILIKQKAEHRRKMAALPFEEKVKIAFALSGRHKSLRAKTRGLTIAKGFDSKTHSKR